MNEQATRHSVDSWAVRRILDILCLGGIFAGIIGAIGITYASSAGRTGKGFFAAALLLFGPWMSKTAVSIRRRVSHPWAVVHLPQGAPGHRQSLQPYAWSAITLLSATIALTFFSIHAFLTYHHQPWAAYFLALSCLGVSGAAVYAARKHAIANGPHPDGPIWWLNSRTTSKPDPRFGGAFVAASGLVLPLMTITGQVTGAPYYIWVEQILLFLLGAGLITMGIIQKRWERTHPQSKERLARSQ